MAIAATEYDFSAVPGEQMEFYKHQIENVVNLFDPEKGHRVLMVMDVDQTILDSLGQHFFHGQSLLLEAVDQELVGAPDEETANELRSRSARIRRIPFSDLGDERGAYTVFDEFPEYKKVNDELVRDIIFHEDMQLMDESIPEIMQRLMIAGAIPGLYLSARPNEVAGATRQLLSAYGCFPEGTELMTRDFNTMTRDIPNKWKAWVISEVTKGIAAKGGKVVVMDDNAELISMVRKMSYELGCGNLVPILMDSWIRTDERNGHRLGRWSIEEGDRSADRAKTIEHIVLKEIINMHSSDTVNNLRRYRTGILRSASVDEASKFLRHAEELAMLAAKAEAEYATAEDIGILHVNEKSQLEQLRTDAMIDTAYTGRVQHGDSYDKPYSPTDFDFEKTDIWFRRKLHFSMLHDLNLTLETLIQPDTVILAPLSTGLLELHQMRAALIKEGKLNPPFTDIKIKTIATAKSSRDTYPGITDLEGLRKFKKIIFYDDTITDSMTTLMLTRETIAQLCQESGIEFINPFDLLPTDKQQQLLSKPKLNY